MSVFKVFFPVTKLTQQCSILNVSLAYGMLEYMKPMSVVEVIKTQYRTAYVRFQGREEIDMTSLNYLHALKDFDIVEHKEA